MEDLVAARAQMGMSLAFHIIFAVVGIAMPLLMVIAECCWVKTGKDVYLILAKRWAKGTAIFFAVGAVSGTVLSFELGLLWPKFMEFAGPIIGLPFALEGFAFFTEAIFLGIYLYGWKLVSPKAHILAGFIVALSGMLSGIFVVIANAWMNTPAGFRLVPGVPGQLPVPSSIDPIAAMMTPAALPQCVHMTLAAYAATAFAVAGIHAFMSLRNDTAFHRAALSITLAVAATAGILTPVSGDLVAQMVAHFQPVKLAAMEGLFDTERGAGLHIGGIPDEKAEQTYFAIDIPYALSLLAFHNPTAEVRGLKAFPRDQWPNTLVVHLAFDAMVGCGTAMALVGTWYLWLVWRKRNNPLPRSFLMVTSLAGPLGILAVEAGWFVTEMGRQPWVIHGVMRTKEAVTPMPGLPFPFTLFTLLYIGLGIIVVWLIIRQVAESPVTLPAQVEARD